MREVDGILFDYGRTLVTFAYPTDDLSRVMDEFRPRIEAALGVPAPEARAILQEVLLPLEEYVGSMSEDEVDYMDVYRAAWHNAGWHLPDDLLHEILDAEQECWDRSVTVDPDALRALPLLRDQGLRLGICSNAPFPPEMMRRQMRRLGFLDAVDAVVLSAEVGRRKPAPELYRAGLQAVGVGPDEALYVGDRLSEDYDGPRRLGMRALLLSSSPPPGVEAISRLAELLERL